MGRKKTRAIATLNELILKTENRKDSTLLTQMKSYIRLFFGPESPEYDFISNFTFSVVVSAELTNKEKIDLLRAREQQGIQFLKDCIETINKRGLYKAPKQNFLHTISNVEIFGWGVPVISALLWLSFYLGGLKYDKEKFNTEIELKKLKDSLESVSLIHPAKPVSHPIDSGSKQNK